LKKKNGEKVYSFLTFLYTKEEKPIVRLTSGIWMKNFFLSSALFRKGR
jgi:hypothetical protein